jgi:hypothetical protein
LLFRQAKELPKTQIDHMFASLRSVAFEQCSGPLHDFHSGSVPVGHGRFSLTSILFYLGVNMLFMFCFGLSGLHLAERPVAIVIS